MTHVDVDEDEFEQEMVGEALETMSRRVVSSKTGAHREKKSCTTARSQNVERNLDESLIWIVTQPMFT